MNKHLQLGTQAYDIITGFKGIITARVVYLSGCNQLLLSPKVGKGGSLRGAEWFDDSRIKSDGGKTIALPLHAETLSAW